MWTPQSIRLAHPSCCNNCALNKVCRALTVAPVLTSVETLLCTPELITRPTLGIVILDSATFVQLYKILRIVSHDARPMTLEMQEVHKCVTGLGSK